jgi:NADPH:quinone reductase-like Zn-dependent oxidoreductase
MLKDIEKPIPKENEILVRVRATTVNRTDCANLRAKPFIMRFTIGIFKPKNPILGTEFAGDIEVIGKGVRTFKTEIRFSDLMIVALVLMPNIW